MTVYGAPEKIEFFGYFIHAIQAVVPGFTGPPMDPPPLPFQLQDPEKLRHELNQAGLREVRVETITEKLEFQSGQQLWDWLTTSNPIVEGVLAELDLSIEQRAVIRQNLDQMIDKRSGGSGPAVLTNPINIGIGIK